MRDPAPSRLTLFLCGDVMTGRGIDQVLPHPSKPTLYEPWVRTARAYVELAERAHGPIPAPVDLAYPWGDALDELARVAPAARIVNLETSVTRSDDPWPGKGIHYRMHPGNVPCLTAARIDCCVLANNHVLDWGRAGLLETLETLAAAGIRVAGAGGDLAAAAAPAVVDVAGSARVLVFAFGTTSSGIPLSWAATAARPGVRLLRDLSADTADRIAAEIRRVKRPGDVVVASIHWGGNWGFEVPEEYVAFARRLVRAGVDVVHGHSSHHVRPMELVDGRLVLYGCGDFIDDYEGIAGHEEFRGDLRLAYFPELDAATGRLAGLRLAPFRARRFRLEHAALADARWLEETINRECRRFGFRVQFDDGDVPALRAVVA